MKPPMHKHPKNEPGNPTAGEMQLYRLSGTLKVNEFGILILLYHFLLTCRNLAEWAPERRRFRFPSHGRLPNSCQHASPSSRFRRHGQRSGTATATEAGLFGPTFVSSSIQSYAWYWAKSHERIEYHQLTERTDARIVAPATAARLAIWIGHGTFGASVQDNPAAQSFAV